MDHGRWFEGGAISILYDWSHLIFTKKNKVALNHSILYGNTGINRDLVLGQHVNLNQSRQTTSIQLSLKQNKKKTIFNPNAKQNQSDPVSNNTMFPERRNQNQLKTNPAGEFDRLCNQNTSVWAQDKETEREMGREGESSSKVLETQSLGAPQSSIERVRWFYHHGRNHPSLSTKPWRTINNSIAETGTNRKNKRPTKPKTEQQQHETCKI